jgi:PAS domain S-box-containing protein
MPQRTSEDDLRKALFAGAGAMRALCRTLDWTETPLGGVADWTESLRTTAATVLGSAFPLILLWGPELVQIYNDGYVPFLAAKHPGGLGQPTRECWPEVWHINAPIYERVRAGDTVAMEDAHFPLRRQGPAGPVEDLYITLSYSPVLDGVGRVEGVLVTLVDTTAQVRGRAAQAEREALDARLHGALLEAALVLNQVRDAYLLMDGEFRIVTVNESAERALARTRAELVGRTHWDAFPASLGAEPERQYRRVVLERVEAHFTHHYVGEGYDFHLEIDAYPASGGGVAVFWRDVSERLRLQAAAEAARLDAETRAATLAAVIESIPDAVLVARPDAVVMANPAALRELGLPSASAVASHTSDGKFPLDALLLDRTTGEPLPLEATPIGRALSGERSHGHFLLQALHGTRDLRPVRAAAAPIVSGDGEITGIVAVLTDMTAVQRAAAERDRLLSELDAERTLLRTVLDQLPAAVFVVEAPSGRVLALNNAVARVWGGPQPFTNGVEDYSGEWVGYHADGRRIASDEWPVARAAQGETVIGWTGEIERTDGTRALIEVNAAPVFDAVGRTVAAVAIATDITTRAHAAQERERLLRALEVERARLTYVFQRAPSFLAVMRGPEYVFEQVNEAYYQVVGHRELLGKPILEALPEVREQGFVQILLDRVRETGEPYVGRETPILLARTPGSPPEERFIDFVYLPLVEENGERDGVIAHGTDVTEQVLARREVERLLGESERARLEAEEARAEAEAANRSKSEFLAVMSHELRTPLNAIGGYAELIEMGVRGAVTDAQRADLARIQKSQRHLLGLINGVLNYAKVDAGAVYYEVTDVPLDEVLATCEALVAPQASAKRIRLTFTGCDAHLRARADREKVQQVVLNLLSNAVKFTDAGGQVSLSCSTPAHAAGEGPCIAVQVRDTGRGIAADQIERIFQPFVQLDAKLTRTQEGTGLGLAISRDLARGMGGDLTVESTLGVGSTFTLVLPAP